MKNTTRLLAALALPALATLGCNSFLDTPDTERDPNNQAIATRDNLFIGAQINVSGLLTGELSRTVSIWHQQTSGTDRQYQSLAFYDIDEDTFVFDNFYSQGGLVDIRRVQASADSAGDKKYSGVAKVLEALLMSTAADIWGDIPYSEALTDVTTPKLDKQLDVYDALQLKLDTAITFMADNSAASIGPGGADLFYGGSVAKWTRAARTLKARIYLHTAEVRGNAAYASALTNAQQGIQSPADDMRTYQSTTFNEQNLLYQFAVIQREGYISAGKYLVDLLRTRNDPRLPYYFEKNAAGQYQGATPGQAFSTSISTFSDSILQGGAYRVPILTAAENKLIIAEAAYRTGNTTLALSSLNSERADWGLPALTGLSGTALLTEIMTEKYIALFNNVEVWSDYRRTCIPALTPSTGSRIPARLLYPASERNTNPNIPEPGAQPVRNQNDPNAC